jgi:RNase P/RNase MRP subunit POP5
LLKGREKRRYLAVLHGGQQDGIEIVDLIKERNSELFGYISTERSSMRFIQSQGVNLVIISCKLKGIDNILSAIALTDPPLVTLHMSGTLKRLGKSISSKELTKIVYPQKLY